METTEKSRGLAPSAAPKPVTMQDIATAVGVSKMAVSYVFNGKEHAVSLATREAILRAAEQMGFEPNPHARRLSNGGCSKTVGLLALGLDRGVNTLKLQAIQRHLAGRGFDVPIYSSSMHGSGEVASANLLRSLCAQRPRAIVCSTGGFSPDSLRNLARYQSAGGVVVTYDHSLALPYDHVLFDRRDNTYQATRHLLELGHRKVAFYTPGYSLPAIMKSERFLGFQDAMQEFGASVNQDWLHVSQDIPEKSGALLAQTFCRMPKNNRPSAYCIVNDGAAATFVAELARNQVKVPDEVSVVGHDDLPIAEYSWLPLTTVSHPVDAIAEQVVELLTTRLDGSYSGVPRQITVRGSLIVRASSAQPVL